MKRGYTHVPEECGAISQILSRIGDKWTVLVLSMLGDGPMRWLPSGERVLAFARDPGFVCVVNLSDASVPMPRR